MVRMRLMTSCSSFQPEGKLFGKRVRDVRLKRGVTMHRITTNSLDNE